MAVIYQGHCNSCGETTSTFAGGHVAVLLDEPAPKAFALSDDLNLALLPHPGERSALKAIGHTYQSAAWSGRLLRVGVVFCRDCGRQFEIQNLTSGGLFPTGLVGCFSLLAIAAGVGFVAQRAVGKAWVGFAVGAAVFLVLPILVDAMISWLIRWKHHDRVAQLATRRRCPDCGSEQFATPMSARGSFSIPCKKCGKRAMQFQMVGRS